MYRSSKKGVSTLKANIPTEYITSNSDEFFNPQNNIQQKYSSLLKLDIFEENKLKKLQVRN